MLLTGASLGQFQLCHFKGRSLCTLCAEKELMAPPHDPIQYCAAVLPVCNYDPAGLGAGTMTVKTTSQGVLHCQIWSLSGGLWPGDGSSKKVYCVSSKHHSTLGLNHAHVESVGPADCTK